MSVNGQPVRLPFAEGRDQRRHRHGPPALHAGRPAHRRREHRPRRRALVQVGRIDFKDAARAHPASSSSAYGLDVDPDELVEPSASGSASGSRSSRSSSGAPASSSSTSPPRCSCPTRSRSSSTTSRELKAQGETIVFISHKLDEVLAIADTITVLRAGRTVATVEPTRRHGPRAGRADGRQRAAHARDPRVHRHRRGRRSTVDGVSGSTAPATDGCSAATSASRSTGARSSAWPASRATARPSSSTLILGLRPLDHGTIGSTARTSSRVGTRDRREAGHRLHPRGPPPPRAAAERRPCGRTRCWATRPSRPTPAGRWIDRAGAQRRTEEIVRRLRRAHPGHRRRRLRPVRRQPAEADRGP